MGLSVFNSKGGGVIGVQFPGCRLSEIRNHPHPMERGHLLYKSLPHWTWASWNAIVETEDIFWKCSDRNTVKLRYFFTEARKRERNERICVEWKNVLLTDQSYLLLWVQFRLKECWKREKLSDAENCLFNGSTSLTLQTNITYKMVENDTFIHQPVIQMQVHDSATRTREQSYLESFSLLASLIQRPPQQDEYCV